MTLWVQKCISRMFEFMPPSFILKNLLILSGETSTINVKLETAARFSIIASNLNP
jgi:hypothetical protein